MTSYSDLQPIGDEILLAHLRKELPGFEGRFSIDSSRDVATLDVRTHFTFGANSKLDLMRLPIPPREYTEEVMAWVDGLIKHTRLDAISKLGLDKEIDAQVEERVTKEIAARAASIRQGAYQEAYSQAYTDAFRAALVIKEELDEDDEEH